MALSLRVVRYGPESIGALSDVIALAQGQDPLRPVTVVVARATVGLAMRRRLAARGRGVLNVGFPTLGRLADDLGGPALAASGRRPVSEAIRLAAVRASLDDVSEGAMHRVRHHPATERALATLVRELQGTDAAGLDRMASHGARARQVTHLVADVRRRLAPWYDEHDLVVSAIERLRADPDPVRSIGRVVVHLPAPLTADERALIGALAARVEVTVLLGATGDRAADEVAREQADLLAPGAAARFPVDEPPFATRVLSTPSADAEVLLAMRGVSQRHRDGTPLERMAVVHGGADPYPRLLHESFALAGIPSNGPGVRPLSATMAGRTLLGALALPDHDWRRDDVVGWLSGGPLHDTHGPVPATRFDRLSRRAGVVAGLAQWTEHLAAHQDGLGERLALLDSADHDDDAADRQAHRDRLTADLALTGRLAALVDDLAGRLDPDPAPDTWAGWAGWARRFVGRYLHLPADAADLSSGVDLGDERQALIELDEVLGRLSVLDAVDPAPDLARFRRALDHGLSGPAPRTSRFGRGVLVGPLDALVGLDLDVVFVVGMTEGVFPVRARDDALLPDDERVAGGADVPLRGARARDAHRAYLAALAAAPERVLSFARGDQRRGRVQRPSRWLLDSVSHLQGGGRRLFSRDLEALDDGAGWSSVPSLSAAVRSPQEPASVADHDLRSLLTWFDRQHSVDGHPLATHDPVLRLGLLARHERRRTGFTRFDGKVDRVTVPSPTEGGGLAPTSLQQYAICPRRYYLQQVLRVSVVERPEDIQRISARDRGSLVHAVLERFIAGQVALARPDRIRPDQRWSDADAERLDEIADEVFAEYELLGLTGRALLWELDRSAIRRDLHRFLVADDGRRAHTRGVPEAVELRFGPGEGTPVTVALPDGRALAFKGVVDRIDRTDTGDAIVVDYKTGGDQAFRDLESDPVAKGTLLQLPIYGLAARAAYGPVAVATSYWFLSERAAFRERGYELDATALDRFGDALGVIVGGIESGAFPARPGDEDQYRATFANCTYCDFDPICPTDRERAWQRVKVAPELAPYVELSEGAQADEVAP